MLQFITIFFKIHINLVLLPSLSLPELLCWIGHEFYLFKFCISFLSFQNEIYSVIYNVTDLTVIVPQGDLYEEEGRSEGEGGEDHACAMMGVPSHNTLSVRMALVWPMTDLHFQNCSLKYLMVTVVLFPPKLYLPVFVSPYSLYAYHVHMLY
jgi:hypothetical protein